MYTTWIHNIQLNVKSTCTLLSHLSLSRNSISDCGASALGEMLKVNKSLVKLE